MGTCFFASDLHGSVDRYIKLFETIEKERPAALFLGGDLLPSGLSMLTSDDPLMVDFVRRFLAARFMQLKNKLGDDYPRVFLILGNDDGCLAEEDIIEAESSSMWEYISDRKVEFGQFMIYGYAYIPPTPFLLKDWERYDVSRYVDPGCVPPDEGWRSTSVAKRN